MSSGKKTILIVDDDKMFSLYLGILLKRMGLMVIPAENSPDALSSLAVSKPDLVLLDFSKPSLKGFDTLGRIMDETEGGVPVIAMSPDNDEGLAVRCAQAGCFGMLPKPVPMKRLHELMQDCFFSSLGFRRKFMRVNARLKVMLFNKGSSREFRTETICQGGLYLLTDKPYPAGTAVDIIMPYGNETINLRGMVIYISERQGEGMDITPGMAVEFLDLSEEQAATMDRLVSTMMTGYMSETAVQKTVSMGSDAASSEPAA